jgi:hypothetical protein
MKELTQLLAVVNCLADFDEENALSGERAPIFYMRTEEFHMEQIRTAFDSEVTKLAKSAKSNFLTSTFDEWKLKLGSAGKEFSSLRSTVRSYGDEDEEAWNTDFLDMVLAAVPDMQAHFVDSLIRYSLALESILNRASLAIRLNFQEAAAALKAFRSSSPQFLRRAVATLIRENVVDSDFSGVGAWDSLVGKISLELRMHLPAQIRDTLKFEAVECFTATVCAMKQAEATWSLLSLGEGPADESLVEEKLDIIRAKIHERVSSFGALSDINIARLKKVQTATSSVAAPVVAPQSKRTTKKRKLNGNAVAPAVEERILIDTYLDSLFFDAEPDFDDYNRRHEHIKNAKIGPKRMVTFRQVCKCTNVHSTSGHFI